jgi:hypothetical protein
MRTLSQEKKKALERPTGSFLQQYRRKAQKGQEPNDRLYDRGIERIIRKLTPEELDTLLNGEEDERT